MTDSPTDSHPPKPSGFLRAFLASVMGTGLSRVLGAVRDIVIANFLGAGASSDAFWIAFTIPNVFRRFVADEGLTGALIPAVARAEKEEGVASGRKLANTVLTALLIANIVLCVIGFFTAEQLVYAFASKFAEDPEKFRLTAAMTRWMMPFVGMVSMVSLMEGLLNHRGHFFVPKVAPGLVSGGIAGTVLLFGSRFEEPAWALVVGVLVGGVAHVLVNGPVVWRLWGPLGLSADFRNPRFRGIAQELTKVIAIGVFAQINILVLRQLAAGVGEGAITRYWYANRLVDLSQGIIAVAIGSALLPTISQAVAAKDWDQFRGDLARAFRLAAFLLVPVAVGLLAFAEPVTSILFRQGAYTYVDVQWTAWTLQALVPFLLAVAGINIIKKVYFALDDRNPLLVIGGCGVAMTAALGMYWIGDHGILGLAWALSLSTSVQFVLYIAVLQRRLGTHLGLREVVKPIGTMVLCALPMAPFLLFVAQYGVWSEGPTRWINFLVLAVGIGASALIYGVLAQIVGIEEWRSVTKRVYAKLRIN